MLLFQAKRKLRAAQLMYEPYMFHRSSDSHLSILFSIEFVLCYWCLLLLLLLGGLVLFLLHLGVAQLGGEAWLAGLQGWQSVVTV